MTYRHIPLGDAKELPDEEGWREWDRAVRKLNGESAGLPPRWLTEPGTPAPEPVYVEPLERTATVTWLDTVDKAYL